MISADTPRPPPPPPPPRLSAGRRPPARRGRRQWRRRHRCELSPASRTVPRVANCPPRRELSPASRTVPRVANCPLAVPDRPSSHHNGAPAKHRRPLVHLEVPPPPAAAACRLSPPRHPGRVASAAPTECPPSALNGTAGGWGMPQTASIHWPHEILLLSGDWLCHVVLLNDDGGDIQRLPG